MDISRDNIVDSFGLTARQAEILSGMREGAPGSGCVQRRICLRGSLDEDAAVLSLELLALRHPALRTCFDAKGHGQRILRDADPPTRIIDLRSELPELQRQELDELANADANTLLADASSAGGMSARGTFRATIIKLGQDTSAMIWSIHPAVIDDYSIALLLRDFSGYYARLKEGQPPDKLRRLAESRSAGGVSFLDYAKWMERQDRAAGDAYWVGLTGVADKAAADAGRATGGAAANGLNGRQGGGPSGKELLRLEGGLGGRLRTLARKYGLSLGCVLEAAWAVLLLRLNGVDELLYGRLATGRKGIPGLERVAGPMGGLVPVRVKVDNTTTALQLLFSLQKQLLDGELYAHCAPAMGGLESLFVYDDISGDGLDNGGLAVELEPPQRACCPLSLRGWEEGGIVLELVYDRELFSSREALVLLDMLALLLQGMAAQPTARLAELDYIEDNSSKNTIDEFNDGEIKEVKAGD